MLQVGHQCKMNDQHILITHFPLQLTNSFNIGQRFNVANGTADFGNYKIIFVPAAE